MTSAVPSSFSESSWRVQRREVSYRRAFSIATAAWDARSSTTSWSSSVKSPCVLLGQVQVPERVAAQHDRHAEEALHRRMPGREPHRARVLAHVVQAQRTASRISTPRMPSPAGQVADPGPGHVVDTDGDELLEVRPGRDRSRPARRSARRRAPPRSRPPRAAARRATARGGSRARPRSPASWPRRRPRAPLGRGVLLDPASGDARVTAHRPSASAR